MGKNQFAGVFILLLNLGSLLSSIACDCSNTPTLPPHSSSPKPPSVPKPPYYPSPKSPSKHQTCPIDALKLGACVDALGGLIHIGIGVSPKEKCCPLLQELADLDAAVCLCTAIKVKALNLINLLVPVSLQVLVNDCGKYPPAEFKCSTA